MAIGINDLDDDDILESGQTNVENPSNLEENNNNLETSDDFMSDFLKSRGIDDPSRIIFEDDNNLMIERDWKDLSKEEKLNILNMPLETTQKEDTNNIDLTDDEISLLNQIRLSNMTPTEYINQLSSGLVILEPQYSIDLLSDDEVYLLDLESRVGELSDEQAAQALNIAKQLDEELYKKQIEGIRREYKEREDLKNLQTQAQLEEEQLEAFNKYRDLVIDSINNLTSIGNLDLNFEDADKENLAEFMLSQDESGKNYLYEALQDPEILTKAAWFILNGEEAFNSITDYFKNLIKMISENQYKKGLEDGKKNNSNNLSNKPTVVINKNQNVHRQYNSIEDLDDEE